MGFIKKGTSVPGDSLMVRMVKNLSAVQEILVRSMCQEDPLATPVFLPGKSHGQRSLVGYSPWGGKELDMTEQLTFHLKKNEESYHCWKFPGCQWLGLGTLTASDPGSIPVGKLKSWKPCGVAKKKKRERKRRKKIVVLFLGNIVVVYLWFFFSPPFRLSTLYFNTLFSNS